MSRRGCRVMESVRLPNNAELERWCRAKILAALDRWQDEEISRRLATEKRRTKKKKTESAPASPGSDNATATTHKSAPS